MSAILEAEMDKVNNLQSDLDALEEALGQEHIEMYIRQLKMELRCARSLADEQVKIERFFEDISISRTISIGAHRFKSWVRF